MTLYKGIRPVLKSYLNRWPDFHSTILHTYYKRYNINDLKNDIKNIRQKREPLLKYKFINKKQGVCIVAKEPIYTISSFLLIS